MCDGTHENVSEISKRMTEETMKRRIVFILMVFTLLFCFVACDTTLASENNDSDIYEEADISSNPSDLAEIKDESKEEDELNSYFDTAEVEQLRSISGITGWTISTTEFDPEYDDAIPEAVLFFTLDSVEKGSGSSYSDLINTGGCIEIYSDEEMAKGRDLFLTGYYLFGLTGGSHSCVNNYVIQLSEELSDKESSALLTEISDIVKKSTVSENVEESKSSEDSSAKDESNNEKPAESSKTDKKKEATMPYDNSVYSGTDWTVEELVDHFEELGFTQIKINKTESFDNDCIYYVGIEDVYANSWLTEYKGFKAGETYKTRLEIRIDANERIPTLTVDNCSEFAALVKAGNDESKKEVFIKNHLGEYIEFSGTLIDWYDIYFYIGVSFEIEVEGSQTVFAFDCDISDLNMEGEYHYTKYTSGVIAEGERAHMIAQIVETDEGYGFEVEKMQIVE